MFKILNIRHRESRCYALKTSLLGELVTKVESRLNVGRAVYYAIKQDSLRTERGNDDTNIILR